MDNTKSLFSFQRKEEILNQEETKNTIGKVATRSKRVYAHDAKSLAEWMIENALHPERFIRSDAIAYVSWLKETYRPATAKRMLSVARNIFQEQVLIGKITRNPFEKIPAPKAENETPYVALTKKQAKNLLSSIDRSDLMGKRDYALISLLLRTGIRRSECAALTIGDIQPDQEHTVAKIQHGKGDKSRKAKIPPVVLRHIHEYIEERSKHQECTLESSLFIGFDRWRHPKDRGITDKTIERIVITYGEKIGIDLSPHSLRASFATLSKEGGANIFQIQVAMGHEDPRTTERYIKRKENLDDNAVDYIHTEEE